MSSMVFKLAILAAFWQLLPVNPLLAGSIRLSEVLANPRKVTVEGVSIPTDYVEIQNQSDAGVSLEGWSVTDQAALPKRWIFPAGASLAPHQTLVLLGTSDRPASTVLQPVMNLGFGLKASGGWVLLFQPGTVAPELIDSVYYGVQIPDFSIGRIDETDNWYLTLPSPGGANVAQVLGHPEGVKINEWMADPASGSDWLELFSPNELPVALGGLYLSDTPGRPTLHKIPALSFLGTGASAFVRFDADGNTTNNPSHLGFKLSKRGATLTLTAEDGVTLLDTVTFKSQSLGVSEGRLPDGTDRLVPFPESSSPGSANFLNLQDVVLNELLSHADDPYEDGFEFYNPTESLIDLSGWFFSDNKDKPRRFRIPEGTVIEPKGYTTFYRYQFQPFPDDPTSFGLSSSHGESLFLFSADLSGELTGYRAGWDFGAAPNNVPFMRHLSSIGPQITFESKLTMGSSVRGTDPEELLTLWRQGRGAPNAKPLIDTLTISEMKVQQSGATAATRDPLAEYLELRSVVNTNLPLFDLAFATNVWWIEGDIRFSFPREVVLAPGGAVVVVAFDPVQEPALLDAFRERYHTPTNVPVYGPYTGMLQHGKSSISLFRPDVPQFCFDPDFGWVPPILVDRLDFTGAAPWPSAAVESPHSLQRRELNEFGNDPVNWYVAEPTPGRENGPPVGSPPDRSDLPSTLVAAPGEDLTLTASSPALGLHYRWNFNGSPLPGATNASLPLVSLASKQSGSYGLLVSNPYGAIYQTCQLTVAAPPMVTRDPVSQPTPLGGNVVLYALATGASPLTYQWYKDSVALRDQTNATLRWSSFPAKDAGLYSLQISNAYGAALSSQASITLESNQAPRFVQAPHGAYFRRDTPILAGASYQLRGTCSGDAPLYHQWLKDGLPIPTATESTLTLTRFSPTDGASYQLLVTNAFGSITSAPIRLLELTLPVVSTETNRVILSEGSDTQLKVTATGNPRLYYQWQLDGKDINAAYCPTLDLNNVQHKDGGVYRAMVRNAAGVVAGPSIEVVVRPKIQDLTFCEGDATLCFKGTPGRAYAVYGTTDLVKWSLLAVVSGDTPQITVTHTNAPSGTCIYRVDQL